MRLLNPKLFPEDVFNFLNGNKEVLDIVIDYLYTDIPISIKQLYKPTSDGKTIPLLVNNNFLNCVTENKDNFKVLKKLYTNNSLLIKKTYLQDTHLNYVNLEYSFTDSVLNTSIKGLTLNDVIYVLKMHNLYKLYALHQNMSLSSRRNHLYQSMQKQPFIQLCSTVYEKISSNRVLYANYESISEYRYRMQKNPSTMGSQVLQYNKKFCSFIYAIKNTEVPIHKFFSGLYNHHIELNEYLKSNSIIDYTITDKSKARVAINVEQSVIDDKLALYTNALKEYADIESTFNCYLYKNSDSVNKNIKVVKGYDIQKYYNVKNYYLPVRKKTSSSFVTIEDNISESTDNSLHSACMRHAGYKNKHMCFYAENQEVCSMLVLFENNKVRARAILWQHEDKTLISRIYYIQEKDRLELVNYANQKGFYNICNYPSDNNKGITNDITDNVPNIKVTFKPYHSLPWIDTFNALDLITKELVVTKSQASDKHTINRFMDCRSTNGGMIKNDMTHIQYRNRGKFYKLTAPQTDGPYILGGDAFVDVKKGMIVNKNSILDISSTKPFTNVATEDISSAYIEVLHMRGVSDYNVSNFNVTVAA